MTSDQEKVADVAVALVGARRWPSQRDDDQETLGT